MKKQQSFRKKSFLKRKEELALEDWLSIVSEVGFPIVVTLYLLHRIERKLDMVNQSILTLPERIKEQPTLKKTV